MDASGVPPQSYSSAAELRFRREFVQQFRKCPIPDMEVLPNLGLFLNRQTLSRILYMHDLYQRIIDVPGVIMEFGVRWGQNLALFSSFRGMYEPYNFNRCVIGFDTFAGFPATTSKDGEDSRVQPGEFAVAPDYAEYLRDVLDYHQLESPLPHINKYELIAGDACETLPRYLERRPETIVAMAYFDFDLYEPTRRCLELIRARIPRGGILAFDQLNSREFPGETQAAMDVLGIRNCRLQRGPHNPTPCFMVAE